MQGKTPAVNEALGVNAPEKACQVLIVDLQCRLLVPIVVLQELDEVIDVATSQVVRESLRKKLVNEFGNAILHGAKR